MKDSQHASTLAPEDIKYIKANNERFSTDGFFDGEVGVSISRRIMKDSQRRASETCTACKYIKANNERFSTHTSCTQ